jgi:hypothetical protein
MKTTFFKTIILKTLQLSTKSYKPCFITIVCKSSIKTDENLTKKEIQEIETRKHLFKGYTLTQHVKGL